jgi:DNA-binding transcriptional regulator YbjK
VDHDVRKRQITDAVVRITVKGGLASATFREVAAEAGVSVRLVQYYFGLVHSPLDAVLWNGVEVSSADSSRRPRRHLTRSAARSSFAWSTSSWKGRPMA